MDEVKEKLEVKKGRKRGITLTLPGVPNKVNEKIKAYQRTISAERGKKINLKTAYVEFLKEHTR